MRPSSCQQPSRWLATLFLAVSAAALGACQDKSTGFDSTDSMATASTAPASFKATAQLGKTWDADPTNITAGIAYANGLESIGQTAQQLQVLKTLIQHHPGNPKLNTFYGKKLIGAGRTGEAVPLLEAVAASGPVDWRVHSALGSAYDQQAEHDKAREQYQKALALSPRQLPVLNNLGMSYAIQGDLKQAEATLREAVLLPGAKAEPRLRQNLALVVGLQGRFEEAGKIASEDLPPAEVDANMAYLKKMLAQPNTWQQLQGETQG